MDILLLGDELPDEAIGIFIKPSFPRMVGVRKADWGIDLPDNSESDQNRVRRFADQLLQNLSSTNKWRHYAEIKVALLESIERNKPNVSGTQQTGDICAHLTSVDNFYRVG